MLRVDALDAQLAFSQTFRPFELYTAAIAIYVVLTLGAARAALRCSVPYVVGLCQGARHPDRPINPSDVLRLRLRTGVTLSGCERM
jgi:hypothetical protein